MASESAQVHSCFFPAASTASNAHKRPLSVRVDLQQPALVQQLLAKDDDNVTLTTVVRVTWALLLRTYTGLDRVCFSYDEAGGASLSSTRKLEAPNEVSEPMVILDIDENMPLQHLLEHGETQCPIMSTKCEYNTSVLLRFGAQMGKTQAPGKAMAMPDSVCACILSDSLVANISYSVTFAYSSRC
jgi:hypothetical protein